MRSRVTIWAFGPGCSYIERAPSKAETTQEVNQTAAVLRAQRYLQRLSSAGKFIANSVVNVACEFCIVMLYNTHEVEYVFQNCSHCL